MNKAISLLVLIHSMTKAEKRYFKLYSNLQEGDKVYLTLFALMEECSSVAACSKPQRKRISASAMRLEMRAWIS